MAVEALTKPIDVCFKSIQGYNKVIAEQGKCLRQLTTAIQAMTGIFGPHGGFGLLTVIAEGDAVEPSRTEDGTFVVYHSALRDFFESYPLPTSKDVELWMNNSQKSFSL